MSYLKIQNLYKNTTVLLFREVYASEKIHGSSSNVSWHDGRVHFFAGGAKHEEFVALFNEAALAASFKELGRDRVTVYGEAYGGKMQGMSATYGKELRFVAFEVRIGESWLHVPNAEGVVHNLGLEFVPYTKVEATVEALDRERERPSELAIRRGMGDDKRREGIVIRPLKEMVQSNGARVIAKHKNEEFRETTSPRPVADPAKLKVLTEADDIAFEYVTETRLQHILCKMPEDVGLEATGNVVKAMVEDVIVEAGDEIVDSKDVRRAIGKKAAAMFKKLVVGRLRS